MPDYYLPEPNPDELYQVLETAITLIDEGKTDDILNDQGLPYHLQRDIDSLMDCHGDEKEITEDIYWDTIYDCLCYAQDNLPHSYKRPQEEICSQHSECHGLRMWAFKTSHPDYIRNIYVKFCLREDPDGTYYVHIDCHSSLHN